MRRFFCWMFLIAVTYTSTAQKVNIIPQPVSVSFIAADPLKFDQEYNITYASDEVLPEAELFSGYLEQIYHFRPKKIKQEMILAPALKGKNIVLELNNIHFPDSSGAYRLKIYGTEIRISAYDRAGIFYGLESLKQLMFHAENNNIPSVLIRDFPRFEWRGMHLDVCRHFFPVTFIKKYIDLLAMHKMNTFHWHLTDDQGWRIEIKKYPKLTELGGWRKGTMVGHYREHRIDSVRYGGYYTQEEIKDVVKYAQAKHITIVPEIEMPGHALAALTGYPELSCNGGPFEVAREWGVFDDVFCAGNEKTFSFLQDVLDEVVTLFPGKYIHAGGDECPKERWKTCAKCQQRIKDEKLEDEHGLQSYFVQRMEKYLNGKGKQIIGWDEILEGGLAPNAAVMSWRGAEGGIAAAKEKHKVVMCPGSHCYLDHYQGNPSFEPIAFGGYTPLEKVYNYEPVPAELDNEQATYVMGAQGNLWSEYILDTDHVEYMALPRMCAMAEVLWTPKQLKDEKSFMQRLGKHFSLLDKYHVNYATSALFPEIKTQRYPGGIDIVIQPSPLANTECSLTPLHKANALKSTPIIIQSSASIIIKKPVLLTVETVSKDNPNATKEGRFEIEYNKATGKGISFSTPPHPKYSSNADFTLVDGIKATLPLQPKQWLAWSGQDVEIIIDLGEIQKINAVLIGSMNDTVSWIYLPSKVELLVSTDNKKFKSVREMQPAKDKSTGQAKADYGMMFNKKIKAQYLKIVLKNPGKIPKGAPGEGENSWVFVDEIMID